LKASADVLASRLNDCKDKRPLIKDKNEEELLRFVTDTLEKREPFYSKAKIIYETEVLVTREDVNEYVRKLIKLL
ncbi:MAG: shikimate kinase, partial [Dysgonomonas mossii]|nr:shikimate kinase [Dysgonomonas mossii]